ncbi:flagellar motor protein MotB [Frigoriglobus tundricola]|uniref:Flagellar motor rotation protein MotB n=1 Tax=Frigoriglobus tundricola TaxID=2774151 RepID=A0A6M5YK86_9BACT|nr:flagellar motor protein MotB [Frigoriglobus tundricola]QJW94375.1 Flagellar motor rotation protein MotB [Frigoriglobus tundricola]
MAKGGGGSWKVAYADFVTAMMAFFLVMWIGAQDVKVRQSVANYFVDPSGVSKAPKSGGIHEIPSPGPVAGESKVNTGAGTRAPGGETPSPATAAVLSWIRSDTKRMAYWKQQAERCRQAAATKDVKNQTKTPEEVATQQLATLLATEIQAAIPKDMPDVYKDLLFGSFKEINWNQVAEDVMLT